MSNTYGTLVFLGKGKDGLQHWFPFVDGYQFKYYCGQYECLKLPIVGKMALYIL